MTLDLRRVYEAPFPEGPAGCRRSGKPELLGERSVLLCFINTDAGGI